MAVGAAPVGRLADRGPDGVDLTGLDHRLQRPVDRGQADRVALVSQVVVDLLGALELADLAEDLADGGRCRVLRCGATESLGSVVVHQRAGLSARRSDRRGRRAGDPRAGSRCGRRAGSPGDRSRLRAGGGARPATTCGTVSSSTSSSGSTGVTLRRRREHESADRPTQREDGDGRGRRSAPRGRCRRSTTPTAPPTETATPMAMAQARAAKKPRTRLCAAATGTTINALTSSRPTVRMAKVTVTAARTTSRML